MSGRHPITGRPYKSGARIGDQTLKQALGIGGGSKNDNPTKSNKPGRHPLTGRPYKSGVKRVGKIERCRPKAARSNDSGVKHLSKSGNKFQNTLEKKQADEEINNIEENTEKVKDIVDADHEAGQI